MINRLAVGGRRCFLFPVFVLPRLRGLAVGFLFNIVFSYLTFGMLNGKRLR